jgi:hypothetical protein
MPTPKILPLKSLPGFRPLYQRAVEGFTYALGADDCPTLVKLKIYGASPVNLAVRAYRLAARLAELAGELSEVQPNATTSEFRDERGELLGVVLVHFEIPNWNEACFGACRARAFELARQAIDAEALPLRGMRTWAAQPVEGVSRG